MWGKKKPEPTKAEQKDSKNEYENIPSSVSYDSLKQAIQGERELLKLITDLEEDEFAQLMKASSSYSEALKEYHRSQADVQKAEFAARKEEIILNQERESTRRKQIESEERIKRARINAEEKRKLEETITQEEQKRVNYRIQKELEAEKMKTTLQMEAKREFDRLDAEKYQREQDALAREMSRQKEMLQHRLTIENELQRKTEKEMAGFRLEQDLKRFDATKDDKRREALELQKIKSEADVKMREIAWEQTQQFFSGEEGKKRMWNIGGVVIGTIAATYGFRTVYPIVQRGLKNYFFKPTLVSRRVRHSSWMGWMSRRWNSMRGQKQSVPEVILPPMLKQKMDRIVTGTINTAKRNGFFGNLMLYGKPGTGKTLFAEKLANDAGLDFAIMSGPSFDQFTPGEAIVEIRDLFSWAKKSKNGLLLFIDEADSFLEDRSTLSPDRVRVLNEWLNQTGTETRGFMCIYETNRPEVLDPAVQSRIARSVEFPSPSKEELLKMLRQYFQLYVVEESQGKAKVSGNKVLDVADITSTHLEEIAEKCASYGFVGRDITNLIISIVQAAYAHPDFKLTSALVEEVVKEQIQKKKVENDFLKKRDERIQQNLSKRVGAVKSSNENTEDS